MAAIDSGIAGVNVDIDTSLLLTYNDHYISYSVNPFVLGGTDAEQVHVRCIMCGKESYSPYMNATTEECWLALYAHMDTFSDSCEKGPEDISRQINKVLTKYIGSTKTQRTAGQMKSDLQGALGVPRQFLSIDLN